MARPVRWLAILVGVLMAYCSHAALADDAPRLPSSSVPKVPPGLTKRIDEITDAVLAHHVDPPARQQMILSGVKALYGAAKTPVPAGLSRRVSAVSTSEKLAALLSEIWPKPTAKPIGGDRLEEAMVEGLLAGVTGGASLMSAKESAVMEQFEGNRYVGIHIRLGMNPQEKCPSVAGVIEGGPADRAGVKTGDLFETIDGVASKGMTLQKAIELLRGPEGTSVTITVRQPQKTLVRTYTIRRGQHARSTVEGVRKRPSGDWDCILDASIPIAYLRIDTIAASTPHDLSKLARPLEGHGHCGIILDLRRVGGTSVHPAVLVTDTLLPGGVIGRVRTAERVVTHKADADALFRGLPIAVLVESSTSGTAEWLAAALQDNKRATIVGTPTFGATGAPRGPMRGRSNVRSRVPVGDGLWTIELVTGYLERGDGRQLGREIASDLDPTMAAFMRAQAVVEPTTGVIPDIPVHTPRARPGGPGVPSPARRDAQQSPNLDADPVVQEAVRVLRRSLEKTI